MRLCEILTETVTPADRVIARFRQVPGVSVALHAASADIVSIDHIGRHAGSQKGVGAEAIKQLCALATEENVAIHLEVTKAAGKAIPKLVAYYKRLGFKRFGSGRGLCLLPLDAAELIPPARCHPALSLCHHPGHEWPEGNSLWRRPD